jgi:hypothetical protein
MTRKATPRKRRWQADPTAIYRVMGMQQAFTPGEQATLNLPVREALQSLRDGEGNDVHWNTLAAVVNVCLLRGERIAPEVVAVAKDGQAAVLDVLDRHQRTGRWGVTHANLVGIEACIDLHEQLIALSTPAQMMWALRDTLTRMHAGHVIKQEQTNHAA